MYGGQFCFSGDIYFIICYYYFIFIFIEIPRPVQKVLYIRQWHLSPFQSMLGPHTVLPASPPLFQTLQNPLLDSPSPARLYFPNLTDGLVWNLFPVKGDFSFEKNQKLQGPQSGSWVAIWIKSLAAAARYSCCCGSRSHGTNFATTHFMPRSWTKISGTVVLGIPTSASSSRAVSRQSSLIAALICSTFSGLLLVACLPECGSLSTDSQPSLTYLCHTFICFTLIEACFKVYFPLSPFSSSYTFISYQWKKSLFYNVSCTSFPVCHSSSCPLSWNTLSFLSV